VAILFAPFVVGNHPKFDLVLAPKRSSATLRQRLRGNFSRPGEMSGPILEFERTGLAL
jgi:hypothetical protein